MKKDFSRFKVLGITLLVTMSSCVAGSLELNAETLRAYGLEFDISSTEKTHTLQKNKKLKISPNSKFRFVNIIESGREHISLSKFSFNHSPVTVNLKNNHFQCHLINRIYTQSHYTYAQAYHGLNQLNRAGPSVSSLYFL